MFSLWRSAHFHVDMGDICKTHHRTGVLNSVFPTRFEVRDLKIGSIGIGLQYRMEFGTRVNNSTE